MTDLEREQTCHGGHPLCDSGVAVVHVQNVCLVATLRTTNLNGGGSSRLGTVSQGEPIAAHTAARSGKLLNASSKIQFRNCNGVTRELGVSECVH